MNWQIEWLDISLSTQSELKSLYQKNKADSGRVLATLSQTAGFGRKKRAWISPVGNLSCSFIFPTKRIDKAYQYNLLAALVLCRCLENLDTRLNCQIKWPNDVWHDQKKLAGILSECVSDRHVLLGLGLNLNCCAKDFPDDLKSNIQTVQDVVGGPVSAKFLLENFLSLFSEAILAFERLELKDFLPEIRQRLQFQNQNVFLSESDKMIVAKGKLVGLDDSGLLILQNEAHQLTKHISGDLSLFCDQ